MRTALYRHFDAAGSLLYVGISLNAVQRLAQHRSGARWFDRITRVEVEWLPSRPAALTAEAIAIAKEAPAFNLVRPTGSTKPTHIPWPSATDHVAVRGEALHRLIWQSAQWAVTDYGIERRDGTYAIEAERLLQKRHGTNKYDWPLHMREKCWVDMDDFMRAFAVACLVHHEVPIARHFAERAR